jgi:hypothetical protein
MKSLTYTLFALLLSANAFAVEIPNQFEDGQVTSASQMNENFQALKAELEVLEARITSLESVSIPNNTKPIFVGFSENSFTGNAGIGAMNKSCTDRYSGSFFCSSKDILESSFNEALLTDLNDKAWLRPFNMTGDSNGRPQDISGHSDSYGLNSCSAWTSNSSIAKGLILTYEGDIGEAYCSSLLPVACCK